MKKLSFIFFTFLSCLLATFGNEIPEAPNPPKLVNDYAGVLSTEEQQNMELKLEDFARQSSTQIVVVIVNTLNGYDKFQYAYELGSKWGIGQKGKNNGIVFLVKQKTAESKGEVFILVGYGLEGVIPDAVAKRIVEADIIPLFKQGSYSGGIDAGLNSLISLATGEFTAEEYQKKTATKQGVMGIAMILFILLFFGINLFSKARTLRRSSIGRDLPFWVLLSMLGSGSGSRSSGGHFDNFSSGGGGFGGFGGGSFGGGGAGGSW